MTAGWHSPMLKNTAAPTIIPLQFMAAKIVQAERRKNKISWFLFRGAAYFQSKIKITKKLHRGTKGTVLFVPLLVIFVHLQHGY